MTHLTTEEQLAVDDSIKAKIMKLVWLNIETGEFSESWDEEDFPLTDTLDIYRKYTKAGWKLIRYDCPTDEDFQFNNLMVIK